MAISNPGGNLNSVPASIQQALQTNYLDLASSSNAGWSQQYVPDLMEKEAEVFGPRTISGFLSQVGAEESMTADQVVWSEQGRLHLSYKCEVKTSTTIQIQSDIDGNNSDTTNGISGSGGSPVNHGIRVNDTIIVSDATNGIVKCLVTVVASSDTITVAPYKAATLTGTTSALATTVLVYGSEYGKGQSYNPATGYSAAGTDTRGANEPSFQTFSNKPIILKDYYEVSGSDVSRIGWVEVTSEGGGTGYLWYLKAESDTRARFTDYLEMSMLESVKTSDASTGVEIVGDTLLYGSDTGDVIGTQGLFDAISTRGNASSGITGVNAATDLAEFDAALAVFDQMVLLKKT